MIFWAVAGPTPGRASSSSAVALFRLTGAAGAAVPASAAPRRDRHRAGARGAADGHHDLLAVEELRGQIDGLQLRLGAGAAGGGE